MTGEKKREHARPKDEDEIVNLCTGLYNITRYDAVGIEALFSVLYCFPCSLLFLFSIYLLPTSSILATFS